MDNHLTTIVVDFDDTIATVLNRDWENAVPNKNLITKINELYGQGWTIHIVTARGQLSCAGDFCAADKKYRKQIESWLTLNNVKYTSLSFEKKLAAFYIDDKGITPQKFIKKFKRVPLSGGLSGDDIFYDSATESVFKTSSNTSSVVEWYNYASQHYNTPEIFSVIGNTIKMECLYPYTENFDKILKVCYSFRKLPALHKQIQPSQYINRCIYRLDVTNLDIELLTIILEYAVSETPITFSHGDFSIDNIMTNYRGRAVYLIDPINDHTLLSSWIIDMAKLYMSIGLKDGYDWGQLVIENFCASRGVNLDILRAHEIGHLCRLYPYSNEKNNILNLIKNKLNVFGQEINWRASK